MSREEMEKLLGGYATDTLSAQERRVLFEAALDDQELFEALAKEQALREVLQHPPARQQLLAALGPARQPLGARAWHWLRRPAVLKLAGGFATLLILGLLVLQPRMAHREMLRATLESKAPLADTVESPAPSNLPALTRPAPLPRQHPSEQMLLRDLESQRAKMLQRPAAAPKQEMSPPLPGPPVLTSGNAVPANPPVALPTAAPAPPGVDFRSLLKEKSAFKKEGNFARSLAGRPAAEYSLLLKGAGGDYAAAPAGTAFHAGDSVRIQVEPAETGYLYLYQKDATGGWNLLAEQPAEKARRYVLPSSGGIESATPAQLELLLVLSRHPLAAAQSGGVNAPAPETADGVLIHLALEFR